MATNIDTAGVYRGVITEAGLGETQKNKYPQWVTRLHASEKFIDSKEDMEHFDLGEPGWVDWSAYDEGIVGYFVLFNSAEVYNEDSKLLSYDKICDAVGWDGTDFASLDDGTHVDKVVMFWVQASDFHDDGRMQVNLLDASDANPTRELRKLDAEKIKGMAAKLQMSKKKVAPKPAKPGKSASGATKESTTSKASSSIGTAATPPPARKTGAPTPEVSSPSTTEDSSTTETIANPTSSLPTSTTEGKAWNFLCKSKGGNTDKDINDAWSEAVEEVAGDRDVEDLSGEEWASVRDIIIKDLALEV